MNVALRELRTGGDARALREALSVSRERMARLFDVSAKTIERWEATGRLPAGRHLRSQLAKVAEIVELGLVVYTPEGFRTFVTSPLRELGGRTPLQAIEQGNADLVFGILGGDHEGLGY